MGVETLAAVTIGGTLLGSAVGAYGQYRSGEAQSADDLYKAQVARNNAIIEEQNATWTTQAGEAASEKQAMETRAKAGTIRTNLAAGGIDVNTGSAAKIQEAQAQLGELDAMTLKSDTARKVYGYKVAETGDIAQAQLLEAEAPQAREAGDIAAFGSLLGGATSAAGYGVKYKLGSGTSIG